MPVPAGPVRARRDRDVSAAARHGEALVAAPDCAGGAAASYSACSRPAEAGEETGMKYTLSLSLLMLALGSTAALAQDRPLTRDEVKAEMMRARAAGELDSMRGDYSGPREDRAGSSAGAGAMGRSAEAAAPAPRAGKTRAEVKEELRRARESGELDRMERSYGGH
jgi:hypothetical protein